MGEVTLQVSKDVSLNMVGTLLHMRGKQPALQPLRSSCSCLCVPSCSGNYLLWNGNIFGGALQVYMKCVLSDTTLCYLRVPFKKFEWGLHEHVLAKVCEWTLILVS